MDARTVEQVRALVQSFQNGMISRRQFLRRATSLLGTASAAMLLAACSERGSDRMPEARATLVPTLAPTSDPYSSSGDAASVDPPASPTPAPARPASTSVAAPESGSQLNAMIVFGDGSPQAPGFLARPDREGAFPGIVVIQEWWGLDDHIKSVARRLTDAGFVALAPDLYRGQVATEPDDAGKLAMMVDRDRAIGDIQSAVNYLVAQPFVAPSRIGVTGFCLGGGLAMLMAFRGQNIGAVVSFYGAGVSLSDQEIAMVSAPVLGLYGERDSGLPVATVQDWQRRFKAASKINEMVIYPDTPHAFFNDTRDSYRAGPAADAWQRMLAWFQRYLSA